MSINDFVELNRNTYNKIASLFQATRQYLWDDILFFKNYLHDSISVLDVGCGTGRLYQLLQEFQGVEYLGVDQSEEPIKMAKKDFPNNNYLVSEMTNLPLRDKEFDFVFCIATLHHLPDNEKRKQALGEIKRLLKSGGYLLMTNWNMASASARKTIAKGKWRSDNQGGFIVPWLSPQGEKVGERYYYGFSLAELHKLLAETGFEVLENFYSKKGKKVEVDDGANMVTIARI